MNRNALVEFSIARPKLIIGSVLMITIAFAAQLPDITLDTNPKNMLPPASAVRVWNDEVDATFALYEDTIVVGISHPQTVLNRATLAKVRDITAEIVRVEGVAARDVASFTTIDNVTAAADGLRVAPILREIPTSNAELGALRKTLMENPLFVDRVISRDERTTAIHVPLRQGANGKAIADRIRDILARYPGEERFHVAGDPVARDTFGVEMFRLMGLFAPIAGLIMFIAMYLMFRSLVLAMTLMLAAMVAIIWTLGLGIGLGFPVHIMSSMAPVFLMAIATDGIHIFNEYYFRYRESGDKTAAIRQTLATVGRPVRYTALATAAGFAVLLFMHIVPVKVFGGLIVFGTLALRLLSFSLIPAVLALAREPRMNPDVGHAGEPDRVAGMLKRLAGHGIDQPRLTMTVGLIMIAIALLGMTRITVNNNMVAWFKPGSEIRIADARINEALGGTSVGYVIAIAREADAIKQPRTLRYVEGLQRHLEQLPDVGKTVSVVDYVKRVNRVLHEDNPDFDAVPDSADTVAQYLFLFSLSAKPSDLDNVVDYPYQRANVWVQLKTWDAAAMERVIAAVRAYEQAHPTDLDLKPAGIAYFNLVWNDEVLWDMVTGFILALAVVFGILAFDFGSVKWALIGFVPLLFSILLIYGVIGFIGKDFDMPIAVLSCLSLGMAVDFSIHFISRFRQRLAETGVDATRDASALNAALRWTALRPGRGILRNAVLFAAAFAVMLFAPLTPYITVGAFIVAMMLISALLTIIYLPALIVLLRGWLFAKGDTR